MHWFHKASEVVSKAAAKVSRLEAALAALEDTDDADGPEATALKEALKKARAQATPANPGRRLDERQQYVERARLRFEKAQEAVVEAKRLKEGMSPEKPKELGDTSELANLRRQVQLLRQERDSWLSNRGGHHQTDGVGAIPTDPSSLMLGLIEEGDAKRRCVGNGGSSMPCSLANSAL